MDKRANILKTISQTKLLSNKYFSHDPIDWHTRDKAKLLTEQKDEDHEMLETSIQGPRYTDDII